MNPEHNKGKAVAEFDSKNSAEVVKNKMIECTTRFKFYLPKVENNTVTFGFGIESNCVDAPRDFKDLFNSWLNKKDLALAAGGTCKQVEILQCGAPRSLVEQEPHELQGDTYTVYVINKSASKETFWLFLDKPQQLNVGSTIYANSAANLTIAANSDPEAKFGIPVQYKLGAKSTNDAVGLNVVVSTSQLKNVNMGDDWKATFYDGPEHQAPDLEKSDGPVNPNEIGYSNNPFNPDKVILNEWYPSQTFGIETKNGFVGMTWGARPNKAISIAPKLKFFVTTGDFSSNTLADYTTVSNSAQAIELSDFLGYAVTVTYTSNGEWELKKGRPT